MRARKAGGRWRFQAHKLTKRGTFFPGGMYGEVISLKDEDHGPCEFDELVVGSWLHVEQMDTGSWWMSVGGVVLWVNADRDGRPTRVSVYGPYDYEGARDGCEYRCDWTDVA